jgi:hypothetical protein
MMRIHLASYQQRNEHKKFLTVSARVGMITVSEQISIFWIPKKKKIV